MNGDAGRAGWAFGIEPGALAAMQGVFERAPGLEKVWIFGSRARGDHRPRSDIDLALDAPGWDRERFGETVERLRQLPMVYPVDAVHWQQTTDTEFRARIERDRRILWARARQRADIDLVGGTHLKPFQAEVLDKLARFVDELKKQRVKSDAVLAALQSVEGGAELAADAVDFPKKAWAELAKSGELPAAFAAQPYSSRFDGAGRAIPNLCLKVPTGGGKTLLASASVARVLGAYLNRHTGLVLWVVPNDAIYRQTLKALTDRDHPYRQILNVAGAGRVKVLEKTSTLTRTDVESHLCVMLLMLQSAARQSKETLKVFRDRGDVLGFLPREDDIEAHWALLQALPNLDAYAPWGASAQEARAQKGSIVKSSLGNVLRMLRPMIVIDEGHHGYTENALSTLDGFNPSFLLELSATPRAHSAKGKGSNILVDVRGTDLDAAEMIKLPINVEVRHWQDWQSCLAAAVQQLDALHKEAESLRGETARYIRPILLVQVERTGAELRDSGYIHAEDARAYLLQLGFNERQIAIKTSEKDELKQPENIDLLSPTCEIRAIITKQALQEGWDCPFAYVLCALAAGRNPAAMTQLVGRILRQPQTAKTGRTALDACYVLCHDGNTADVVRGIKRSLEQEGMGDLAISVRNGEGSADAGVYPVRQTRRPELAKLRLFLPRVTWVEDDGNRRELVYDSDILARLPWEAFSIDALAREWAPDGDAPQAQRFQIGLDELRELPADYAAGDIDRARIVRSLLDLAPNAWLVWDWVSGVVKRLTGRGFPAAEIARSSSSLIERLRVDVEAERDRLAQAVFDALVAAQRIEFRLRADATDYELPHEAGFTLTSRPQPLSRDDARPIAKSLLEPALRTPDMNDFEAAFAGYLDEKQALRWWHRNVAKTQYGLQGWKRNKLYPDFVFAYLTRAGASRTVLLETKGLHLQGSTDTAYKQALLARLTQAFRDERHARAGELVLAGAQTEELVCDILFEPSWRGSLEARHFSTQPA